MKISARNVLRGTVTKVEIGAINAEVTIEVGPEVTIVSNITSESARNLGLERGSKAYAVIKASSVILGTD